jgi:transcriptional regulator with XRE-family HTH domain
MPRPSKRVAPDTLGGKLRAARQGLRFSLADVAGSKYSTSLISQIERNRVDPSMESLEYLSERLKLPLDDLLVLARQHRESETEANLSKAYEEKYAEINLLLSHHQSAQALEDLQRLDVVKLPIFLRWRTLAQRGQSYFEQRKFSEAQRDFQSALTILPSATMPEYPLEIVKLRLHLAAATRELHQLKQAREYYQAALAAMNGDTPLLYIAQSHWGIALVYHRQAQDELTNIEEETNGQETTSYLLQKAWQHATDACTLYRTIADVINAALLQCQLALIEQAQ